MKSKRTDMKNETLKFSVVIAIIIIVVGIVLSFSMYFVIQKSFFKASVAHEMELMRIMESLGSQLTDSKLQTLKTEAENTAQGYGEALAQSTEADKKEVLSSIKLEEYRLNYCYQDKEKLYCGKQFKGEYAAQLDLSEAWEGKSILYAPDFDAEDNYILAVAVPVWQEQEVAGILIEQLDGYCLSEWIGKLFSSLDFGTAYIIDGNGRNIATAREENYDWITTRYNAQELVKENADESTKSIAILEKNAMDGKTGIDTYQWEGNTSYVAYGPLSEVGWGFCVGFYGDKFEAYTQEITAISSRIAAVLLLSFALFLGAIIAVVLRNLSKERRYSEMLVQQKAEIEQQAFRIAASEERFRVAMQRSRDIILEYQLETGEITCFYEGREVKSGRVGDDALRKRLMETCCMDGDSFERFEEVMRAIRRGLTSAECVISGNYGDGTKWYSMSVSAIPNESGRSMRAVGILRDVTGEREAKMDSLTRLLNKSTMTGSVKEAMQNNLPTTASAFVMIDVDYFKMVNDQFGHPVGDQVLCAIADKLRKIFPEKYLLGRFGGDEFSVYCPSNADLKEIKNLLKQLSEQVKRIRIKGSSSLSVTLSIGAVIFYGRAEFEEIYKKADEVLYQVKETGRDGNSVVIFSSTSQTGSF